MWPCALDLWCFCTKVVSREQDHLSKISNCSKVCNQFVPHSFGCRHQVSFQGWTWYPVLSYCDFQLNTLRDLVTTFDRLFRRLLQHLHYRPNVWLSCCHVSFMHSPSRHSRYVSNQSSCRLIVIVDVYRFLLVHWMLLLQNIRFHVR